MKEPVVFCDECGRPKNKRWVTLNTAMTTGLAFCASFRPEPMVLGDLGRAFGNSATTYLAFYCLRYFGLADWYDHEHPKNGLWVPTAQGLWFLEGMHEVPRRVRVFNNQVIERDPRMIGIESVPYVKVDIDYARSQMDAATDEDVQRAKDQRDNPTSQGDEDDPDQ